MIKILLIPLALLMLTIPNAYADHNGNFVCPDGTTPVHDNEYVITGLEDVVWYCNNSVDPTPFEMLVEDCCRTSHDPYNEQLPFNDQHLPIDDGHDVVEEIVHNSSDETVAGFTGWKQEGNRMVAYRLDQVVNSYEIGALPTEQRPEPNIDTTAFDFTEDAGILSLRLQIMQVLESILSILFRL